METLEIVKKQRDFLIAMTARKMLNAKYDNESTAKELCKAVVEQNISEDNPILIIPKGSFLTINSMFNPNGECISKCYVQRMWLQNGMLRGIVDYEEEKGVKINMSYDREIDWVRLLDNLCDLFIETEDEDENEEEE